MTTIVRRRALGLKSVKGIIEASDSAILRYANNYQHIPDDDVYIRWGCTSNLPNPNATVVNEAKAIHLVNDKSRFRNVMLHNDVPMPKTWFNWEAVPFRNGLEEPEYPLIVRSRNHAQGRGLFIVNNPVELAPACDRAGPGYYINEFIPKKNEYRVFVIQGRVAWVAKKTPGNPEDVAWNVAKGGRFDNVRWDDWPMPVVRAAIRAWKCSGLHFAGVDVMEDNNGVAYVLEANSAPSQTSPYRQSCVAKVFDYMQEHGYKLEPWDVPVNADKPRDAIHPAINPNARGI